MYLADVKLHATQSGYEANLSFKDSKGKLHEKQIGKERRASMQSNYLEALIETLETLQKPCMLSIYSRSDYITEPIRQGWLQSWAVHDWRNAKGKEVRNAEQWKRVKKLLPDHSVRFVNKED